MEEMGKETYKQLTKHFTKEEVQQAPKGKFGNFVPHHLITKRLNEVVPGKWNFVVKEIIRNKEGMIEGAVCSLYIHGLQGPMDEVGDVDNNDKNNFGTESQLLKLAFSDGIKRCAMRYGIGLHLWTGEEVEWYGKDPSNAEEQKPETKSSKVEEQKPKASATSVRDSIPVVHPSVRDSIPNAIEMKDYYENLLAGEVLSNDELIIVARKLISFGMGRMLNNKKDIELYTPDELVKLKDITKKYYEDNKSTLLEIASDKDIAALSEAGIEATKIEEEDMAEIPDGKWKEDGASEAQLGFILDTLIPETIDAGQDAIAKECQSAVNSGNLTKGEASAWITKLKEAKQK